MLYIYKNVQKQPSKLLYTKSCSKNFANFTGKHLCQCLFSNKLAGLFPHSDWILRIFPYAIRMRKRPANVSHLAGDSWNICRIVFRIWPIPYSIDCLKPYYRAPWSTWWSTTPTNIHYHQMLVFNSALMTLF